MTCGGRGCSPSAQGGTLGSAWQHVLWGAWLGNLNMGQPRGFVFPFHWKQMPFFRPQPPLTCDPHHCPLPFSLSAM